ncbi:MAG TPA: hypothetical protein VMW00_05025 [Dehalococcoidales bacterium]|nr:hypothetical protein [Dehalococcoidales bacterium]
MPIKNPKDLLLDAIKYPVAVEAKLPEGAPKISTMLIDATNKIPVLPDLPMEIPDLPAPPELPALPGGAEAGLKRRYVTSAVVTPVRTVRPTPARATVTPLVQEYTQPIGGVIGQVSTRRGM